MITYQLRHTTSLIRVLAWLKEMCVLVRKGHNEGITFVVKIFCSASVKTRPVEMRTGPEVLKLFVMLNSAEHEIYPSHKC